MMLNFTSGRQIARSSSRCCEGKALSCVAPEYVYMYIEYSILNDESRSFFRCLGQYSDGDCECAHVCGASKVGSAAELKLTFAQRRVDRHRCDDMMILACIILACLAPHAGQRVNMTGIASQKTFVMRGARIMGDKELR